MDNIFLVQYNYGEYDSYTEVNLHAFGTRSEAEEFRDKDKAAYERSVNLSTLVSQGMQEWRQTNPHPKQESPMLKMPQWSGKKGSKKNAPPEVLREFKAREDEARAEYERVGTLNAERQDAWYAQALAETKRLMAEVGYTQEEIDDCARVIWHSGGDDRDYDIVEIPFGVQK